MGCLSATITPVFDAEAFLCDEEAVHLRSLEGYYLIATLTGHKGYEIDVAISLLSGINVNITRIPDLTAHFTCLSGVNVAIESRSGIEASISLFCGVATGP